VSADWIIQAQGIVTRFGSNTIHDGLSLQIARGELVSLIGGSGSGKSLLLRELIGLHRPNEGKVTVLGTDVWNCDPEELTALRRRIGVLFQDGALFSTLDVLGNVSAPILEHTTTPPELVRALALLRLSLAGLGPEVATKMPSELSGGMRKRAAMARALSLEPEILFLDEPTAGLDPVAARAFDRLVRFLCDDLGITVMLVTHDLDTLTTISGRVLALAGGKVVADGTLREVMSVDDPWIRSYFAARGDNVPAGA